jgi:hypothetical protein
MSTEGYKAKTTRVHKKSGGCPETASGELYGYTRGHQPEHHTQRNGAKRVTRVSKLMVTMAVGREEGRRQT